MRDVFLIAQLLPGYTWLIFPLLQRFLSQDHAGMGMKRFHDISCTYIVFTIPLVR